MPFGERGKTYFTIAEGRALKPIIVPGQAMDKSVKGCGLLDGQPPMNHSKWKAPPDVLWKRWSLLSSPAGRQNLGF
jgi:hypothetical protein